MNSKIMFLWGMIIVFICSLLIILGNIGPDYNLYKMEKKVKYAAKEYFEDNDEEKFVLIQYLIDDNYLRYNDDIDKYCLNEVIKEKKYYVLNSYKIIRRCKK